MRGARWGTGREMRRGERSEGGTGRGEMSEGGKERDEEV